MVVFGMLIGWGVFGTNFIPPKITINQASWDALAAIGTMGAVFLTLAVLGRDHLRAKATARERRLALRLEMFEVVADWYLGVTKLRSAIKRRDWAYVSNPAMYAIPGRGSLSPAVVPSEVSTKLREFSDMGEERLPLAKSIYMATKAAQAHLILVHELRTTGGAGSKFDVAIAYATHTIGPLEAQIAQAHGLMLAGLIKEGLANFGTGAVP